MTDGWSRGTCVKVCRKSHVYNCGDDDHNIYFVESGQIKTTTYSLDGRECLLSIYAGGDLFGELCIRGRDRTETATAMCGSVVRRVPFLQFRETLRKGELLDAYLTHLTLRLSEQQEIITNLVTMDCERRLAAALLILARKLGRPRGTGTEIDQRITQEELSDMVGTTRSRVGFFLSRFCAAGLVHRAPNSFIVVDEVHLAGFLELSA